jgi:hypothetical protein
MPWICLDLLDFIRLNPGFSMAYEDSIKNSSFLAISSKSPSPAFSQMRALSWRPDEGSTDSDFRQDISTQNDISMSSELCDSRHRHNAARLCQNSMGFLPGIIYRG